MIDPLKYQQFGVSAPILFNFFFFLIVPNKITIINSFHAFFCFYFSICLFWIRIRIQGGNGLRIHADLNPIFLILLRSHTFTVGSTSPIALFPIYYCFLICSEGEKVQF